MPDGPKARVAGRGLPKQGVRGLGATGRQEDLRPARTRRLLYGGRGFQVLDVRRPIGDL